MFKKDKKGKTRVPSRRDVEQICSSPPPADSLASRAAQQQKQTCVMEEDQEFSCPAPRTSKERQQKKKTAVREKKDKVRKQRQGGTGEMSSPLSRSKSPRVNGKKRKAVAMGREEDTLHASSSSATPLLFSPEAWNPPKKQRVDREAEQEDEEEKQEGEKQGGEQEGKTGPPPSPSAPGGALAQQEVFQEAWQKNTQWLLLHRLPSDGPQLSKAAKKALLKGKVTVAIMKKDANLCLKNNLLDLWDPTQPFFRENSLSLLRSVLDEWQSQPESPMGQQLGGHMASFLSFLQRPESWIDPAVDPSFEEGTDPFAIAESSQMGREDERVDNFLQSQMSSLFLDFTKKNTRYMEQDTTYHSLEGKKVLVIGDVNAVANTMAPLDLTYAQACDRTIKSVFGCEAHQDLDQNQKGFRRSNDFPVLVGLDTVTFVRREGRVYPVDFCAKTGLVPLLLTTATEAILRVQMQYLSALYGIGCVKLCPKPVESNSRVALYGLDDEDRNSLIMNVVRSDSFLYQVCIRCEACGKTANRLWTPGVDTAASASNEDEGQGGDEPPCGNMEDCRNRWLEGRSCDSCGSGPLENLSAFVMRDASSRQSLDPASLRQIHWEIPTEKKKPLLPTDITSKSQLARYEYVKPEGSAAKLRVHSVGDYPRKNQRTGTVAVTLFVPVAFNVEATVKAMEEGVRQMLPPDTDSDQISQVAFQSFTEKNPHLVEAYTYLGAGDSKITMTLTRVKLTLTCNRKSEPVRLPCRLLDAAKWDLLRVKNTVDVRPEEGGKGKRRAGEELADQRHEGQPCALVTVDMPAVQTNKRIGVQTVHANGTPVEHSSKVLLSPAVRVDSKRQKPTRQIEDGTMYSALNFWSHPKWGETSNFLRYGCSMVAGLVHNMKVQGTMVLPDQAGTGSGGGEEALELLPLGSYPWIDEGMRVDGSMSPDVASFLYGEKKIAQVGKAVQGKEADVRQLKAELSQLRKGKDLGYVAKLEKELQDCKEVILHLEEQKRRLVKRNKNLLRQIRTLNRRVCRHEVEQRETRQLVQSLSARSERMTEQIQQLMAGKTLPSNEPAAAAPVPGVEREAAAAAAAPVPGVGQGAVVTGTPTTPGDQFSQGEPDVLRGMQQMPDLGPDAILQLGDEYVFPDSLLLDQGMLDTDLLDTACKAALLDAPCNVDQLYEMLVEEGHVRENSPEGTEEQLQEAETPA